MSIAKYIKFIILAVLGGLPVYGQIKIDTFPKNVEIPDLTKQQEQSVTELHAFLWQHWTDHHPAIAQMRSKSKEGSPTLTTIMICPDQRQRWAITVLFQSSGVAENGMMDLVPSANVAYSLEVVEEKPDGSVRVIPNPTVPFPRSYQLRYKGQNGWESIF